MCYKWLARSLGLCLVPLATCCIIANLLLFFPNGQTDLVKDNKLTKYVWFFMGIGGGGVTVLVAAIGFLCLGKCDKSCGKHTSTMCCSVLTAVVGMAGSGYCFSISAIALLEGPLCFTGSAWESPFESLGPQYLFSPDTWSVCTQPVHIVEWNTTLLSIQLGLSTLEFLICMMQLISGLLCSCCY